MYERGWSVIPARLVCLIAVDRDRVFLNRIEILPLVCQAFRARRDGERLIFLIRAEELALSSRLLDLAATARGHDRLHEFYNGVGHDVPV